MTQPSAGTSAANAPAPGGAKWPVIIVGLLLLNVAVCAVTVTISLRNPASVEPDYYDKAMNCDASRGIATDTTASPASTEED